MLNLESLMMVLRDSVLTEEESIFLLVIFELLLSVSELFLPQNSMKSLSLYSSSEYQWQASLEIFVSFCFTDLATPPCVRCSTGLHVSLHTLCFESANSLTTLLFELTLEESLSLIDLLYLRHLFRFLPALSAAERTSIDSNSNCPITEAIFGTILVFTSCELDRIFF